MFFCLSYWFKSLFLLGQIDGQEITVTAVLTPTVRPPPRRLSPHRRMPPPPPMWRRTPPRMRRRWAGLSSSQLLPRIVNVCVFFLMTCPSFIPCLVGQGHRGDAHRYAAGLDRQGAAVIARAPVPTPPASEKKNPFAVVPILFLCCRFDNQCNKTYVIHIHFLCWTIRSEVWNMDTRDLSVPSVKKNRLRLLVTGSSKVNG